MEESKLEKKERMERLITNVQSVLWENAPEDITLKKARLVRGDILEMVVTGQTAAEVSKPAVAGVY